jgi:hypothetical protein
MTSKRQIAANRRNSRNSTGPRSAAGEQRASRNALRHGLAATAYRPPVPTGAIARLARAICGPDDDPLSFGAAVDVAESHFMRRAIQEQQIAVIERLREATAIALAKGDNSLTLARARLLQAWLANREIEANVPKLREKYNVPEPPKKYEDGLPYGGKPVPDWLTDPTNIAPVDYWMSDWDEPVPIGLKALLEESESDDEKARALDLANEWIEQQQRDQYQALEEALPDLIRLQRYERRSWSRFKAAIYAFMNIKVLRETGTISATSDA